jgi:hypothetical protein
MPEGSSPAAPVTIPGPSRLIIQTILLEPSGAVWVDEASNVSRPDLSGAF